MFELRNKDEIWYKDEKMITPILYGKLEVLEPFEENKFKIKKFNFDTEDYEICTNYKEYSYNGRTYSVIDGIFEVEQPTPQTEPTQLDKIQENQLTLMEAVAEQYEENLTNRINDMEVQASIYEAVLALGGE